MSASTSTSFYRLSKEEQIKPKIIYGKNPVRADGSGTEIKQGQTNLPTANKQPAKEPQIHSKNVDGMWKSGNYNNNDEPFKTQRLTSMQDINGYYSYPGFVPYSVPLPPFDPSDTITLNTEAGVHKQWQTFLSRTGKHGVPHTMQDANKKGMATV